MFKIANLKIYEFTMHILSQIHISIYEHLIEKKFSINQFGMNNLTE